MPGDAGAVVDLGTGIDVEIIGPEQRVGGVLSADSGVGAVSDIEFADPGVVAVSGIEWRRGGWSLRGSWGGHRF